MGYTRPGYRRQVIDLLQVIIFKCTKVKTYFCGPPTLLAYSLLSDPVLDCLWLVWLFLEASCSFFVVESQMKFRHTQKNSFLSKMASRAKPPSPGYTGLSRLSGLLAQGYTGLFRVINRLSRLSRLYGVMSAGLYRVIAELYRVIPGYAELWPYGLWAPGYNLTGYWEITRRS